MSLRDLPSVDKLLQLEPSRALIASYGHELTVKAIRDRLERARQAIRDGSAAPKAEDLLEAVRKTLQSWVRPTLRPVINATGVIVHTNLGRAPLSQEAQRAVLDVAADYSTLEYDLQAGQRGKREEHASELLTRLTEAESALVVNNNAAAVLLALTALAQDREVLVSRTQLIEIGGGFRVPDVMRQSGAILTEVGTTNRTHLRDFERALCERTGLILHAHHSNFRIIGFTTEPSLAELVRLGERHGLPVLADLGSGALLDTPDYGLGHEPMVQETLQDGAALVAFSGDKLLGGPQAGILVGKGEIVQRLRAHPLARAVRPDKLCLAALTATLTHYLKGEAVEKIPVWRMIATPTEVLQQRAQSWAERLGQGEVLPGHSTVGGGSLPEEILPSWLLALTSEHPNQLAARLRACDPPVIARVKDDRVLLDPRTVPEKAEEGLLSALESALAPPREQ